jgi:LuxR family maltose regulon positive regulatory protein
MSVPNIQNDKYTPNPLPEIVAPRKRLLIRFDQAASSKLIFISAPAGSGKTVSALLWIKKSNRNPVWIGLDTYDNSVSVFYRMFCDGILSAQPDNSRMIEILQNPAFNSNPVEHTIMLLREFSSDEGEYVLALDDFHAITNQEILKSFPHILRRLPHSFVTLILSRNEPDVYLSAYMESKQSAVIGSEELSFNTEEIYDLFKLHRKNVTAKEAEAAFNFTGGWAIAVITLAQNDAPAPEYLNLNALVRYVRENIWPEWDETTKAFLIASAAVDEMPVVLCEKITGRTDAGALLEHLQTQSAYLTRTEDGVYRYHNLFLDALRAQPEFIEMDKTESYCAAAEYYANKGNLFVAADYAYRSGNMEIMLYLLDRFMSISDTPIYEYANSLKDFLFIDGIEALCEKLPVLYGAVAYIAFLTGDVKKFELNMDKHMYHLPEIMRKYPKLVESAIICATLDYRTPIAEQFSQLATLPSNIFQEEEMRQVTFSAQMPFLHRSSRDLYELTDKKTYEKYVKGCNLILKNNYEPIIYGINAGLYLEQNRITEALSEAKAAVGNLTDGTAKEIRFSVYMHLAALYFVLNKKTEFTELLEKIEMFINGEAEFLRPNYLAFTARVKLWNGETAAAWEWLDHYFVNESTLIEPYKLYQYFTTVRAYAVLGELEKAKDLALRLRKTGKDFRRPQNAAEAGVLLAVVLWTEGNKQESQEMMETVLSEMQPYSFIRLIADEGVAVLQVLRKIYRKTKSAGYQGPLDPVYVNGVYIAAYTVCKQRKGIMTEFEKNSLKLSKQQKMILRLLAQGYKRNGIAEKTDLSLNTIKSHMKAVYEKLGVDNAADAVVKARELGIVE